MMDPSFSSLVRKNHQLCSSKDTHNTARKETLVGVQIWIEIQTIPEESKERKEKRKTTYKIEVSSGSVSDGGLSVSFSNDPRGLLTTRLNVVLAELNRPIIFASTALDLSGRSVICCGRLLVVVVDESQVTTLITRSD